MICTIKLYDYEGLMERADGAGYGEPALNAKDVAYWWFMNCYLIEEGVDISDCDCPEDLIFSYIEESGVNPLFDEYGHDVGYLQDGRVEWW